jgi:hypothetical protein
MTANPAADNKQNTPQDGFRPVGCFFIHNDSKQSTVRVRRMDAESFSSVMQMN